MSYLDGFSRHYIGDEGTQRMVDGVEDVGVRGDEEPHSTSYGEVFHVQTLWEL